MFVKIIVGNSPYRLEFEVGWPHDGIGVLLQGYRLAKAENMVVIYYVYVKEIPEMPSLVVDAALT